MPDNHLHIVTHDVPYPADFGGAVDLFYKIKALHQLDIKIHLHCFTKKRAPQKELNNYCQTVNYYPRKTNASGFSLNLPYIVNSRRSAALLNNLKKDNYPILLEGIHCTYYLQNNKLKDRKVIVRLHNAEFEYYHNLAKNESKFLKKIYFTLESKLLRSYEKKIAGKAFIAAMSKQDIELYQRLFAAQQIYFLPAFSPYNTVQGKEGKGSFCLYHGNLSVNENEKAVMWLLENVFNDLSVPFIIAGKEPSKKLQFFLKKYKNVTLLPDPSDNEMQALIADAHINILPSFNKTGVKLKLLNALFNGRHCLLNKAGVEGSKMEAYCHIAETADEFKASIDQLLQQDFTEQEIQVRKNILQLQYNNELNAKQLISWLY